jgi:hypothetical protein
VNENSCRTFGWNSAWLGLGLLVGALGLAGGSTAQAALGIAAANIQVVQHDTSNNVESVTVTTSLSVNDFRIRVGSNRGDYNVQIGDGFSDDADNGVIMTCVAENGRNNAEASGTNYCTTAFDLSAGGFTGAFFLPVFNAPGGAEYNINIAAAYFTYSNWLAGFARNSGDTNAGVNDVFTGSPGLALGTHFIDQGGGVSIVNLTNIGVDSRTDGILLVTHAKNEDNYALSQVNSNNGTWTIHLKDNGTDAAAHEQDPVAFVFVPKTNTTVVSGRFRADGNPLIFSGVTPQFNVTILSNGVWRLTIPGHSPSSGVLIISPEGGRSANQDNIVSYQPDGNGWIIQSRDLPANPPTLETPGSEPVASFVFIPASSTLSLVAPTNSAQNVGNNPDLQVGVSNAAPGNLTVKFYGRVGEVNPATDFTIVALPDTQFYVSSLNGGTPSMFYSQAEWIITNRVPRNIAYVAHLGDISQSGDIVGGSPNTTEWRNATNALYRIESPARTQLPYGIPYGMAVGNHDEEPIGDANGTTTFYNQYFGVSHFAGRSYYAGHYGNNNDNHFDFFSAGGMDFVALYFKYDENANPAVLAWGNEVLRTNANRRAIVVTHNFGNTATPVSFSPQGAAIYNALKTNKNLFLMMAGHVTGEGSRVDTYNGNVVRTFVSDYQGWTNGGNGFLRIITFSPTNNTVLFQTYSPWADEYKTGPTSELWFNYNMQQALGSNGAPYSLIGTVSNVPPSTIASLSWPGRQPNTAYEWYVVVTDALGNSVNGPIWRFSTAPNIPPIASNQTLTVYGDAPTNLTLIASDWNGDPLTFRTNSAPLRGINSHFNPANGTLLYSPVRGYRGADLFQYSATDGFATSSIATLTLIVVAPPDTNANSLPDAWETAFSVNNPQADSDGDGQSNGEEYRAGTNPTNAASVFRILSATRNVAGQVTLVWSSVGCTRYRVEYANGNLGTPFNDIFRPLAVEMDPTPYNTPSTQTFVDDFTLTAPATNSARQYRIKLVQ